MLRTYRVNFRKNWVVQPSLWNLFLKNLALDMRDILDEMSATEFSFDNINAEVDEITIKAGKDDRIEYPKL